METSDKSKEEEDLIKKEIDTRMDELRRFLTRIIGQPKVEKPRVWLRLRSKIAESDGYAIAGTKLGILVRLFEKYLICRVQKFDITNELERDTMNFIVDALISESGTSIQDFAIKDLWKIIMAFHTIRTYPFSEIEISIALYGKSFTFETFMNLVFKKMSYFGEFLYYCTSDSDCVVSLLSNVKDDCTEIEKKLIEEVRKAIKPELGIATIIVCRHWMSDAYRSIREDMKFWINLYEYEPRFEPFYDNYLQRLEQLEKYELLKEYFKKFIKFLRSEASPAHRYFDHQVLISQDCFSGFKDKKHFMELEDVNKFLVRILKFFVEAMLSLYNENENSVCFKELPLFFKDIWNKKPATEYIANHLIDASQLLDFIFVDQFENNFSEEFHKICTDISDIAVDKFHLALTREPVTKYCLFPFFDVNTVAPLEM